MQNIPLTLAISGLVLAKDVARSDNPAGPPVCGKGLTLTDSLIERLKDMGIQSITVEGHPIRMDGDNSLEEMLAALDRRFKKVEGDPLTMKLKMIYKKQIIKSMGD